MDHHLRKLIDDPRFLKYHAETVKGKKFNQFDVLRYSDYEIRHSNVLAWLFQPNETHGIGEAFRDRWQVPVRPESPSETSVDGTLPSRREELRNTTFNGSHRQPSVS